MNTQQSQSAYFDIFRALKRGGLSLWLNRRVLLSLTMVPTAVSFLTLMLMRDIMPNNPSPFLMALIQIPSDFITGLFCALIIFIIISAPKKRDSEKPVIFTLNLKEKKGLFVSAAIANVVFTYFLNGMYALMTIIYLPMQKAAETDTPPSTMAFIVMLVLMAMLLYMLRFIFLPVLLIAGDDIRAFFKRHKKMGLSFHVFAVKMLATIAIGFCILLLSSPMIAGAAGDGETSASIVRYALADLIAAFGGVISAAWVYASLSVAYRQMIEGKDL